MSDATLLEPQTSAPTRIEPGGIEAIPDARRHGSPWQLFSTWTSPNLEFATIFVGVIAVVVFGLGFWQAIAAIVLGSAAGALTQGILSTWGPREGLAQMVLGRTAFGYRGNIVPAALNTVMAGLGWFAVNSVSGAFALATLTGMPTVLALLIIVVIEVGVAFIGHDLVQVFERYASYVLGAIFIIATITIFLHADLSVGAGPAGFSFGGFTLAAGAAFGYAAGWNPYASDYSRYLPRATKTVTIAWAAGLGNFVSCVVLMAAGAAAATIAGFDMSNPTDSFTSSMPQVIRDLTLVAIAVGAIAANALNIYSGAMSFLAAGIKIPFALRRALVALGFGIIGFFIAWSALADAGEKYENFLLVIAYWISPWLGVVLTDRVLRRGTQIGAMVTDKPPYRNAAGVIAFVISLVVSVWLFSNQTFFVGVIPAANPAVGDLTAVVGFVLAAVLYFVLFRAIKPALGAPHGQNDPAIIAVDAADDVA
ncbi:purine-cytosine permease family protein [Subtercola lobariae]|uniref:Cytosine permease n=1 Tax=Subtercola lobariae TaxID=1588641 RepID=A0A917B9F1_9MICO|nr:cytosine permease [Subtercola lobariae]GGF32714.1 cytosine permease [Subtercola lobariae]